MARPNEATLFIFVLATILQNEIPTRTITLQPNSGSDTEVR